MKTNQASYRAAWCRASSAAFLLVVCFALTTRAATVYDLRADWSDIRNPNGTWSYRVGTNSQRHVFRSSGTETFTHDWQAGDIIAIPYEPNATDSGLVNVVWTSPLNGTISIDGAVWLGAIDTDSDWNNWSIYLNGRPVTRGSLSYWLYYDRAHPCNFEAGSGGAAVLKNIPVSVGDTVMLELANVCCYLGVNMAITAGDFRVTCQPSIITELTGVATISVERLQQLDVPVNVSYAVIGGTATPGVDFVLPNGVLEYAAGISSLSIPLTILDDALVEGNETILLGLTNPVSGSVMRVPLTILDDDRPLLAKPVNVTLLGLVTNVSGADVQVPDVQVVGTYAYVCDSSVLAVIDVSNPRNPRRIGGYTVKSDINRERAGRFAVSSNYAYVPGGGAGLQVIDITDPSQPILKAVYAGGTSSNSVGAVTLVHSNAYVSVQNPDGTAEIEVVDVSDPAHLVKISTLTVPNLYPWTGFEVSGTRLYGWLQFATYSHGLVIIDANDPKHPEIVGQYPLWGGDPSRITVDGAFLYTAQTGDIGWMWAVHVFDLRDPARPVQLRRFGAGDLGFLAEDLQLSGNYLYAIGEAHPGEDCCGLFVLDVSDPTQPVRVGCGSIDAGPLSTLRIHVVGNRAYVASGSDFNIFEITEPPAFIRLSVVAGRYLSLSWNDVAKGMKLQRATRLTNPDWQVVPGEPGSNTATLPIGSGPEFFRLVKP